MDGFAFGARRDKCIENAAVRRHSLTYFRQNGHSGVWTCAIPCFVTLTVKGDACLVRDDLSRVGCCGALPRKGVFAKSGLQSGEYAPRPSNIGEVALYIVTVHTC